MGTEHLFFTGGHKKLAILRLNMLSSLYYNRTKALRKKILFNGRKRVTRLYSLSYLNLIVLNKMFSSK